MSTLRSVTPINIMFNLQSSWSSYDEAIWEFVRMVFVFQLIRYCFLILLNIHRWYCLYSSKMIWLHALTVHQGHLNDQGSLLMKCADMANNFNNFRTILRREGLQFYSFLQFLYSAQNHSLMPSKASVLSLLLFNTYKRFRIAYRNTI